MIDFAQARKNMVDSQIRTMGVIDERILDNFLKTPREIFVPESLQHIACIDEDLEYTKGRFLIEPSVHARLLETAEITADDLVLDIGCGTGYSTAILSTLGATIIALETNEKLLTLAQKNWKKLGVCNVVPVEGPLELGVEQHAPYDVIIINGAIQNVPDCLYNQLAPGGRILTVIKNKGDVMGEANISLKNSDQHISSRNLFEAGTKSFSSFYKKPEFAF